MGLKFSISAWIPASPAEVYDAWLSSEGHAAMTGAPAECSAENNARFHAWGGYIEGRNVELLADQRIVQAWRTSRFSADEADSLLEISLAPEGVGTRVSICHSRLPAHGMAYHQGWQDHYFTPMTAHFSG